MKTRFVSFVSHSWVMFLDLRHFTSSPVSEKIKAKLHRKQEIDLHETMRNKRAFEVYKNLANRSMVPRLDPILFDTIHTKHGQPIPGPIHMAVNCEVVRQRNQTSQTGRLGDCQACNGSIGSACPAAGSPRRSDHDLTQTRMGLAC